MSETLGSIIDKLITVDMKLWGQQEILYEIRRMTFEEFSEKYCKDIEGQKKLYSVFKSACDLNYQRSQLITELDKTVVDLIKSDTPEYYIQNQHKTY